MRKLYILFLTISITAILSCEYSLEDVVSELTVATKFNVTYNKNGADAGSAPQDQEEYQEGFTVTVLDNSGNLEKASFNFSGWNTAADGSGTTYTTGQTFIIGKSNVALYAKWTNNPVYRITYNGNGAGSGSVPVDNTYYETGSIAAIPGNSGGLVKSGYSFIGWNTQSNGSGTNYTQGSLYTILSSNVTLYAVWSAGLTYRVIYIKNFGITGTGTAPVDTTNYQAGAAVTVRGNTGNMVYAGYAFNGWNTIDDGSGTSYQPAVTFLMPADDMLLYAMWSVNQFTVNYNGNSNTGGATPGSSNYNYGSTVTVASNSGNLARTGYTFGGWNTLPDGSGTNYTAGSGTFSMGSSNVTLYARWNVNQYIVTYNGNFNTGGSVPGSVNYNYESTVTVASNSGNLTRTGYCFGGWNSQADGNGVKYTSGQTFTMGVSDMMLYAKWADTVYVSATGSPANSGFYTSSPKSNIADGIALAQSSGIHIVKIAAGTYTVSSQITMAAGVSVQGGWNADFTARNWTAYQTILQTTVPLYPMFLVADNAINGDIYEGLYIDMNMSSGGTPLPFQILNDASPIIQDNNVYVRSTYNDGGYIYGYLLTPASAANVLIRRNVVRLYRANSSAAADSARAIYFLGGAAGANITIEKNRISVYSNKRADGIRIAGSNSNIIIKNNIISNTSTGSLSVPVTVDSGSPNIKLVNNTIYSYSMGSTEYGVYFNTALGSTYIVNNIFHSQAGGYGINVSSGTPVFMYNLTFGFGTHASNFTPDGTNSYYANAGTFANVFVDNSIDANLSDGDDTNYHIDPADSSYAYDEGMNAGNVTYGSVIDDIDEQNRPLGSAYDRGADER